MNLLKNLTLLSVLCFSFGCSNYSNDDNMGGFPLREEGSKDNFLSKHQSEIDAYNSNNNDSTSQLIVLNDPFDIKNQDDLYLYLGKSLVYIKSKGFFKLPNEHTLNTAVNPKIIIVKKDKAYVLSTKTILIMNTNTTNYYLSFYPNGKSEVNFSLIPSDARIL